MISLLSPDSGASGAMNSDCNEDNKPDDPNYEEASTSERQVISLQQKKDAVNFWCSSDSKKRRQFSSVKNRFRFVKSENMLWKWDKQLRNGNALYFVYENVDISYHGIFPHYTQQQTGQSTEQFDPDKQKQVNDYVVEKFRSVRQDFGRVHDFDLRNWALQRSSEVFDTATLRFGPILT